LEQALTRKQIIVTDLTRMRDFDVCVAGVEVSNPRVCLRPLLSSGLGRPTLHPDEHWLRFAATGPIRLFSVVELDVDVLHIRMDGVVQVAMFSTQPELVQTALF
jgi:hypothetical protein